MGELVPLALPPRGDVIALLEDLLERARAGEIRGIAVAMSCSEACEATTYQLGDATIADLLLPLVRVQQRLLDHREP